VDGVRLSVADDGRGFDPAGARIQRTLGLVGMRERLAALGGELRVVSAPGAGTVVTALIPRPAAATAA
jgi:signal transduction histidine kinase